MLASDVKIYGPQAGNNVSVTGTSTSAQNLGADTQRILLKVGEAAYIRFGTSSVGAAVSTDYLLEADKDYVFDVAPFCQYFRVLRVASDSTLYWAKVA